MSEYPRIDSIVQGREYKGCYIVSPDLNPKNGSLSRTLSQLVPRWTNGTYDRAQSHFSPNRTLFIDIETCGLSGDDITWLVGVSYVEKSELVMRLLLARDPMEENAVMQRFFDLASKKPYWVSFNGKSFDKDRIIKRARAKGIKVPPPKGHVDAYHLYKESARERGIRHQSLIEWERIRFPGFHRKDHIPGSEIPRVVRNYWKGGDPDPVRRSIDHNADDIKMLGVMYLEALAAGR